MTESQEIQQIEYRWQPTKDMAAVASSMSPDSFRSWVQRIGPWVRQPAVNAPTDSVRYEMFGDRSAALAWRQRDRQAVEFDDGQDGRPLASRVLLGPAGVLTPEVAMAVCYAGLPTAIGPRPGTVAVGTALPALAAATLTGPLHDQAAALDQAAAYETGLEQVIAAALADRDTPLCVQLPERIIAQSPQGGSQALLLWGLRRTVGPLLGRESGRRGWSFSTFELPQSDIDPGTLPDIIFRLAQAAPQGGRMATRKETRVWTHDPGPVPITTVYQHLARLLTLAYQDRGSAGLSQLITACAGKLSSAEGRIQAVHHALDDRPPAAATVTNAPVGASARTGPADPATDSAVPVPVPAPAPAPATTSSPVLSRPFLAPQPPSAAPDISPAAWWSAGSTGQSPQHPAPLSTGGDQPRQAGDPSPPATLSTLLALLSAGPDSPEFESVFQSLRAQNFLSEPHDRAVARRLVRDHGWYVDVFRPDGSFEDMLVMIFSHTVLPDLRERRVLDELISWVGPLAAPTTVIRALYATTEASPDKWQLMNRALGPVLARRWLTENEVQVPVAELHPASLPAPAPAPARTTAAPGPGLQGAVDLEPATGLEGAGRPTAGLAPHQGLLYRKVTLSVPLVLVVCVALITLFLVTLL
jgi:hypothetical protein